MKIQNQNPPNDLKTESVSCQLCHFKARQESRGLRHSFRPLYGWGHRIRRRSEAMARQGAISLPSRASGFTLVEMMLVVAIIGILAALVIPKIAGKSEQARETAAQADIRGGIKSALDQFEVDNGHYPSSLQDLLQQPRNANNWHGPYLDPAELPTDPWGNPYLYAFPGKHNPTGYDLWSGGPEGKTPIGNWPSTTQGQAQ